MIYSVLLILIKTKKNMVSVRAFDISNKVMHYDFQFIKSGNDGNDWIVFTSDKQKLSDKVHPFNNPYFQQQFIIEHGIGKYDPQNKEYFLGDLVQTDTDVKYVDYNKELNCYGVRSFEGGGTMSIDGSWPIIGNIHQDSKLILGK